MWKIQWSTKDALYAALFIPPPANARQLLTKKQDRPDGCSVFSMNETFSQNGWAKHNVDAAVFASSGRIGVCAVIGDHNGQFTVALKRYMYHTQPFTPSYMMQRGLDMHTKVPVV